MYANIWIRKHESIKQYVWIKKELNQKYEREQGMPRVWQRLNSMKFVNENSCLENFVQVNSYTLNNNQ